MAPVWAGWATAARARASRPGRTPTVAALARPGSGPHPGWEIHRPPLLQNICMKVKNER